MRFFVAPSYDTGILADLQITLNLKKRVAEFPGHTPHDTFSKRNHVVKKTNYSTHVTLPPENMMRLKIKIGAANEDITEHGTQQMRPLLEGCEGCENDRPHNTLNTQ